MKKLALFLGSAVLAMALPVASASAAKKTYEVCKHGCKYSTIQKAVDAVKNGSKSVVAIDRGTYSEGVIVNGHRYDGLTIEGTGKSPADVVLNGKHAVVHGPGGSGAAQNGIEGENVNDLRVLDLYAKNYAANGVFIHADPSQGHETCHGFQMSHDWASFNHSYGLFAKHCIGGSITHSKTWGQGDSGLYIGETPPQSKPKWTDISQDVMYENVLGYSGTNSKYVNIHDNVIYNNGAGVVPNTLDSEEFEPTGHGKIVDNKIFWNNFNYYKPSSPVKTVSGGLGTYPPGCQPGACVEINYPTGIGVALFGGDGWLVKDNDIFGNFYWGVATFSNPFNDAALSENGTIVDNRMGRGGQDTNRFDFFNDGSGGGTCFDGNHSSTFDVQGPPSDQAVLYPSCPAPPPPASGTGTTTGDSDQFAELAGYVTSSPPCKQEDSWVKHPHPKYKHYKPIAVKGPCPGG